MKIVHLGEIEPQPWKNGRGTSWEIAADGPPPTWRLSLALIDESAPFSNYAGFDRTIVAIDGGDVELDVRGERVALERGVPYEFPGEVAVTCTLSGEPARDFNVMTRRDLYVHDVEMVAARQTFVLDEDERAFVFVVRGDVLVDDVRCTAGDTALIELGTERVVVAPDDNSLACVVRITEF